MKMVDLCTYITSRDLLQSARASGQLPIYLFPYQAKNEDEFMIELEGLIANLIRAGMTIHHRDIFELSLEILKEDKHFNKLLEVEPKSGKSKVFTHLSGKLEFAKTIIPVLVRELVPLTQPVLFLSGFGKCYPFLRAKNIIHAIETNLGSTPVVVFFPGTYDDGKLQLFGQIPEHSYRAIDLAKLNNNL